MKKTLRKEVLAIRDEMPNDIWKEKSSRIHKYLLEYPPFETAEQIICYVNYKKEVETLTLIEVCLNAGKSVYCPLVSGKEMEFYQITSTSELKEGFRGILEPCKKDDRRLSFSDGGTGRKPFMIMPGAVFDEMHHRIGYGGGYYDRYLQKAREAGVSIATAALAFSFQIKKEIPWEAHDICPQLIITEDGVL